MKTKATLLLAALALSFGLSSCKRLSGGQTQQTPAAAVSRSFAYKVKLSPVKQGRLLDTRNIAAQVEPTHDSRVAATVGGQVSAVFVDVGDAVKKGDVLVQLDDRNYRNQLENARLALQKARLNLDSTKKRLAEQEGQIASQRQAAKENLDLTRKKLDEIRSLYEIGGAAALDVRSLEVAYEQAQANYAAADAAYKKWLRSKEEDLRQLGLQVQQAEVALKQAEQAVADARITAPFSGEVAERFVEVGAFVGPGAPAVRLIAGPPEIRFKLPPDEVARLVEGELVFKYLGREYPLELKRTSPVPGRDLLTSIVAAPTAESDLPLGASGTVQYSLLVGEGSLIPAAAIRTDESGSAVFTVSNGRAVRRAVEVIGESRGVAVVSGLDDVTGVIYPLPQDISDGSPVEVLR